MKLHIGIFLVQFCLGLALPTKKTFVDYINLDKETIKCQFLKDMLIKPKTEFLAGCPDFEKAIKVEKFTVFQIQEALCLLYYNSFRQLCSTTQNLDEGHIRTIINEKTIKVVENYKNIDDTCRNFGQLTPVFDSVGLKTMSSDFKKDTFCKTYCVDTDATVLDVCQLSSFMLGANAQFSMLKNQPPLVKPAQNNDPPKEGVQQQHEQKQNVVDNNKTDIKVDTAPKASNTADGVSIFDEKKDHPKEPSSQLTNMAPQKQQSKPLKTEGSSNNEPANIEGVDVPSSTAKSTSQATVGVFKGEIEIRQPPVENPKPPSSIEAPTEKQKPAEEVISKVDNKPPTAVVNAVSNNKKPEPQVEETPLIEDNKNTNNNEETAINLDEQDDDTEPQDMYQEEQASPLSSEVKEKPSHLNEDINDPNSYGTDDIEGESYFFSYFMTICVIFVLGYVGYHNKQKILALVLEGRKGKRPTRGRRPNSANYHKLDSNLEEAVTSSCSKNTSQVIY